MRVLDSTANVIVAAEVHYHRSFDSSGWPWEWGWGPWKETSRTNIYRDVTFSNTTKFAASSVSKIVINGTNSNETIIEDRASVSIDTDVYGNGGNDVIITGKGNDRVWGGLATTRSSPMEETTSCAARTATTSWPAEPATTCSTAATATTTWMRTTRACSGNRDETNILIGGAGNDISWSPGKDTIEGGSGNDTILGLANDDTYVFKDGYGTDKVVDYHGHETLDFSGATSNLSLSMSADFNTAFTADAGAGNHLAIDGLFYVDTVKLGTGNDHFSITELPFHQLNITDAGGTDIYDFDLDKTDVAQNRARVDIVDNGGTSDHIDLDVDSTGFDVYLHPQAVLVNH